MDEKKPMGQVEEWKGDPPVRRPMVLVKKRVARLGRHVEGRKWQERKLRQAAAKGRRKRGLNRALLSGIPGFLATVLLTVLSGASGCFMPVSAERLAAYYEPSARARKNIFGAEIELGTSFTGHASYNAETGGWDVQVESRPEPVLAAQAERATALERLREVEAQANVEIAKVWSQAMTDSISAIAMTARSLPSTATPDTAIPASPAAAEHEAATSRMLSAAVSAVEAEEP